MALNVGDKCPQCKVGLIESMPGFGVACSDCSWDMEISEVVKAAERAETEAGSYKFRPASIKVRIEVPDEGEEFLRGLIIARQNNNSPLFEDLIDGVNSLLEPYREAKLLADLEARGA